MVEGEFQALMRELGLFLQVEIPELRNDSCMLDFRNSVQLQIELSDDGRNVTVFCNLGEVPVGRFRDDVFAESLKWNGRPYPRHGTLAFSKKAGTLTLFETFPIFEMTGEKLNDFVLPFLENAKTWHEALKSGRLPTIPDHSIEGQRQSGGLFGLRP